LILYLDTSALVKLYAVEEGREAVEHAVEEAELIVTSAVAYAEARATLARKHREGVFSEEEHSEAVAALDEDRRTLEVLSRLPRTSPGSRATWPSSTLYVASTPSTLPQRCWYARRSSGKAAGKQIRRTYYFSASTRTSWRQRPES
jgi:predicted nucleic acid-binding protein